MCFLLLCHCSRDAGTRSSDGSAEDGTASKNERRVDPDSADHACPALEITIDGEKVEFPYAYATLDTQFGDVQFSLFDGDVAGCNAARLPGGGFSFRRQDPFEDIGASDSEWRRPDSTLVDILKLSTPNAHPRIGVLRWREVDNADMDLLSERRALSKSEFLGRDTVEVCIPEEKTVRASESDDDDQDPSHMTIRGLVRAKMCGEKVTPKGWHDGELECGPLEAEEGGQPVELEFFVSPEPRSSLFGFRKSDGIGCNDVPYQRRPLVDARIYSSDGAIPLGHVTTFTTDRGVRLANRTQGNFIAPLGSQSDRVICLHHPVYWYQDGKIGSVRGRLSPTVCPPL